MTDLDRRLRDYQAFLDSEYPVVDVASAIERRREVLESLPANHRSRRSVFALAFAVALVAGGLAALLTLDFEGVGPASSIDDPVAVETPLPDAPPTSVATTAAPATTIAIVTAAPPSLSGHTVRAAMDADGGLVVAALTPTDMVALVWCAESNCAKQTGATLPIGGTITVEGDAVPRLEITDVALLDGRKPVVAYDLLDGGPSAVLICHDPLCSDTTTVELRMAASTPQVLVGPRDGRLRIAYWDHSSHDLTIITCNDPRCDASTRSVIVADTLMPTRPDVAITADDRPLIAYEQERGAEFTAWVAQCLDTDCVNVVSTSLGAATEPRITDTDGSEFLVWYREGGLWSTEGDTSPESVLASFDLSVAACDTTGCLPIRTFDASWELLEGWTDGARIYPLDDGTVGVVHESWSPDACARIIHVVELDVDGRTIREVTEFRSPSAFDAVGVRGTGLLVLVDGAAIAAFDPYAPPDLGTPSNGCG
jgi:hypothetical protein